jgi:dipeptidyl aminopeptidase/acylaminoacyl peptidase
MEGLRRFAMKSLAIVCAAGPFAAAAAAAPEPELIPRKVFFGNPDRANVQISPDGLHLAYLAPHKDVMNVWVQTVGSEDARPVTSAAERPIRIYLWAANGQQVIYAQDRAGDENFHLYAVSIADGTERDLTPFEKVQARPLMVDRNFPDDVLAMVNDRNPQVHDVWRVNTRTGERSLVCRNDEGYAQFIADSAFNVRIAIRINAQGGQDAFIRADNASPWSELASWDMQDMMTSGPAGFTRDGKTLYMLDSRNLDTGALFTCDPGDLAARRPIASNPRADVGDTITDPKTGRIQAVAFEYTRREWQVLDPSIKTDLDSLRAVEDGELEITSRNDADTLWTVAYLNDDGPTRHFLYDRAAKKARFLFTNRSELEGRTLAPMRALTIRSRDGLDLVSYLTTPVGRPAKSLPMVLFVHGGPWARDSWGYHPYHQWLANRGYAVLSVNFRGSTGFGKNFINAANREWSGRMHDDLIDAVNWAVKEGIADPKKVAIMGGSYGGYATLVGLTGTPTTFACGVDIVGPSHIRTLLETIPPYWAPMKAMFETRVGALAEPEYLDSISPLMKADRIERPLLIAQGKNDPRVKEAESRQIVDAMQKKSIPVTYVVFPDEGHGFAEPVNSMAFTAISEAFLAQHLGGRAEPLGSDVRASSAQIEAGAELVPGLAAAAE